jgi:hypothetical protein
MKFLTRHNASRQMSAILNLDKTPRVRGFQITRAALVPVTVVRDRSVHVAHTDSWKFLLRDEVWNLPDVRDVIDELRTVSLTI